MNARMVSKQALDFVDHLRQCYAEPRDIRWQLDNLNGYS